MRIRLGTCSLPVTASYEITVEDEVDITSYRFTDDNGVSLDFRDAIALSDTLGENPCIKLVAPKEVTTEQPR